MNGSGTTDGLSINRVIAFDKPLGDPSGCEGILDIK